MAGSINKVILVGNLGDDPERASSTTAARSSFCAWQRRKTGRKDRSGNRKEQTEWHNA